MNIRVEKLQPGRYKDYEEFTRTHESTLLYQTIKFKNLIEEITKAESHYLLALDDSDNIKGILPLLVKNGPLGKVINSLPFYGSNGGILTEDRQAFNILLEYYNEFQSSADVASSTIIENPIEGISDYSALEYNELDYRIGQFTQLPVEGEIEKSLMDSFHFKTRNMIRKSLKSGVKIHIDCDAMDFLWETHQENMMAIDGQAKPREFFDQIPNYFKPESDYKIYLAAIDGKDAAALLVFYYGKTIEYFTPVIRNEYRSLQPMSLLICKAMVDGAKTGYERWNWGGTWESQEGVYRFKSRWNTRDLRYNYYINIRNPDVYDADTNTILKSYPFFYVIPFSKLKK